MVTVMKRPSGLVVVVVLAVVQGVGGFLRANHWFEVGVDLVGQGVIFIPLMGLVAIARGGLVAGMAVLYVLFAVGAFAGKKWAWWVGVVAALMNVFLVLNLMFLGESIVRSLFWLIVPVIVLYYLSNAQRHSLRFQNLEPH